jgi:hypothetical protein
LICNWLSHLGLLPNSGVAPPRCGTVATPGPGPRPITSFEYQIRHSVPTNLPRSTTGNNLVSRGSGSSAATMSSQSATGSRDAVQDTLNAIMCRLDNFKLKLEPLQLLQMRMEALEAAVTDQDRHQQELQDTVHRVEMAQSAPSSHRPPPRVRRGTGDDENGDPSHNSHSTVHKASVTHCHG